jgi:hypothetical protein
MKYNVRKVLVLIIFLIVVVGIALFLLAREDLYGMLDALRGANYGFVILAIFMYTFSTIFWSARWRTALYALGQKVRLRDLYLVVYGSIFINNVTPLTRTGGDPIGRTYLLQKSKRVPYASGFASVVSEYILDAPVFLSFLALGLLMYLGVSSIWPVLAVIGIWMAAVFLLVPVFRSILRKRIAAGRISGIIVRVLRVFRRRVSKAKISKGVEKLYGGTHIVISRWRTALCMITFSILLWTFDMLRVFFVFQALGYQAPLTMLLLASTLPTIAGFVPLLPGGIGLVDATFVSVFMLFGFEPHVALAATLIERAISYVFSTFVGAGALSYLGIRVWSR